MRGQDQFSALMGKEKCFVDMQKKQGIKKRTMFEALTEVEGQRSWQSVVGRKSI